MSFIMEEVTKYLEEIPESKLKYHDPDDEDESADEYYYLDDQPVIATITHHTESHSGSTFNLYFKNGGAIRHYGYIMIENPTEDDYGSTVSFCEGEFRDEFEFNSNDEYDLLTTYNILKKNNPDAKNIVLDTLNLSLSKPVTYKYGYLWMNAKIMNVIDEVIEADMDPKCESVADVTDDEDDENRSLNEKCTNLYNLISDYLNNLN